MADAGMEWALRAWALDMPPKFPPILFPTLISIAFDGASGLYPNWDIERPQFCAQASILTASTSPSWP